jgi:hypothetical protein
MSCEPSPPRRHGLLWRTVRGEIRKGRKNIVTIVTGLVFLGFLRGRDRHQIVTIVTGIVAVTIFRVAVTMRGLGIVTRKCLVFMGR